MHSFSSHISNLFATCTELRQTFNALERQAEVVQEISMNASVTAAQTGSHVKTCAEIASQIAVTGRRMRAHVETVRAQVNQITSLVLKSLVHELRLTKYQEAVAGLAPGENHRHVQATIERHIEHVFVESLLIQRYVHQAAATLRGLSQCQSRLFAALSAFEIESIDLYGAEFQAIAALVESLNATTDEGTRQIDRIAKILGSIKTLTLNVQEKSHKELVRAKVRAA